MKEVLFHLQVKLTTELTEATSQISTLQLEVAALRKKEFELQQQLGTTTQDTRKQQEELDQLRTQHKGLFVLIFSWAVKMYSMRCCTTPSIGISLRVALAKC